MLIFIILLLTGFSFGRLADRRHRQSIQQRELKYRHKTLSMGKIVSEPHKTVLKSQFVSGNVVMAVDYYKQFITAIYHLIGGEVKVHHDMLKRARREAILRMQESAPGADEYINVRVENTPLNNGMRNQTSSIEVVAYATAIYYAR